MTQALVLMLYVCWSPNSCTTLTKEVDSLDECISLAQFSRKDFAKMRAKVNGIYPKVFQFSCKYLTQ